MNAVLLNESGGDFAEPLLAEERAKMDAKPVLMALHIDRAALAGGQREELAKKLIGGLVEGDAAARRFAAPHFSLEFEKPILGEVLRVREAVGLWC